MKRSVKHLLSVAASLALTFSTARSGFAAPPLLHAQGTDFVNAQGQTVILRGVNLGGWLVQEMWSAPFNTKPPQGSDEAVIKDDVGLWKTLERHWGKAQTEAFKTRYREAWLNESDFKRIHDAGFNSVRLPFLYDQTLEPGGLYTWLDRALDWAKKYDIYVVLDMHGAPGRQADGQYTGEEGRNEMFRAPAQVEATAKLWGQIALRYRDRPEVAAYDLLNEPMGAPNNATLYGVQDHLYRAIRAVDTKHVIMFEDGYKGFTEMPYPVIMGWDNVAFSIHSYDFNAKTPDDHIRQAQGLVDSVRSGQLARNVPFYLGEFNVEPNGTPDVMRQFIEIVQRQGWSWGLWTYKVAGPPGGKSLWGLYYAKAPLDVLNPFGDTPADMERKTAQIRTENMVLYPEMQTALQVPPTATQSIIAWRSHLVAPDAIEAARWSMAPTGDAEWREAPIGADVFDKKPGFAWLRATLPKVPGPGRYLSFGSADDNATVYLNGQKVGEHKGYQGTFEVPLDAAWRDAGPNEVAVLIENTNAGGGLTGPVTLISPLAP